MHPLHRQTFWLGTFVAQALDEIYFGRSMMSCLAAGDVASMALLGSVPIIIRTKF